MNLVAAFNIKSDFVCVYRDNHGHWFVSVNDVQTQCRLSAVEIVRYLANAAHREN